MLFRGWAIGKRSEWTLRLNTGALTRRKCGWVYGLVVELVLSMPAVLRSIPNIKNKMQKEEERLKCTCTLFSTLLGRNLCIALGTCQQAVYHRMMPFTLRQNSETKIHFFILYASLQYWVISKRKLDKSESSAMTSPGNTVIEMRNLSAGTLSFPQS